MPWALLIIISIAGLGIAKAAHNTGHYLVSIAISLATSAGVIALATHAITNGW